MAINLMATPSIEVIGEIAEFDSQVLLSKINVESLYKKLGLVETLIETYNLGK